MNSDLNKRTISLRSSHLHGWALIAFTLLGGCSQTGDSGRDPGPSTSPQSQAQANLTPTELVARFAREYQIPSQPQPFLEGLSDLHTQEQLRKERELLVDYAQMQSPRTAGNLGALYTQTESGVYAIGWLTKAITSLPEEAEYWYWLGVDLYFLAKFEEAKTLLVHSRELGGQSASLERFVGEVEVELEQPELAMRAFTKSLELDSKGWHSRLKLAGLQEDAGDLEAARSNLEFLIRLDSDHPTPHFRLARILRTQGELELAVKAERAHRRAAILDDLGLRKANTNPIQKHLAVGWALSSQKHYEDALVEYRAAANMTLSGELADQAQAGIDLCLEALKAQAEQSSQDRQP